MTPDVNVLVAAFRADHPHHATARQWLDTTLAGPRTTVCLLPVVVSGFLQLTTHKKVFKQPDPIEDVIAFVDALLAVASVSYQSNEAPWAKFRSICHDNRVEAPLVTDALIAASVLYHKETLVTFDRDFVHLLPKANLQLLAVS